MTFALIGVPTSVGSHGPGQDKAPEAFRRAGLVERLRSAGVELRDQGDLPVARYLASVGDPRQRNLDAVVEVAGQVADRVKDALDRGLRGKLGGLVVTEVNPDHDPDGSQLPRLVDGLSAALAA